MTGKLTNNCCSLSSSLYERSKEGCNKAYYLEGSLSALIPQIKHRLAEQDQYIEKLEKRMKNLEDLVTTLKSEAK